MLALLVPGVGMGAGDSTGPAIPTQYPKGTMLETQGKSGTVVETQGSKGTVN